VKPKYKTAASRRKTKIDKALTAVQDSELSKLLRGEFGDKFKETYIADALKALQKELAHLRHSFNGKIKESNLLHNLPLNKLKVMVMVTSTKKTYV
jgi:hypothetical protein